MVGRAFQIIMGPRTLACSFQRVFVRLASRPEFLGGLCLFSIRACRTDLMLKYR